MYAISPRTLSHCRLNFPSQTQWSAFYAPGPEILAYINRVVEKYKLLPYIRLRHELVAARWDEEAAKWHLRIRRGPDGEEFDDTADVLFLGTGALSRYRWPDIPGLDTFGGTLVHSARWDLPGSTWQDDVVGWSEKDVGVIGNVRAGFDFRLQRLNFFMTGFYGHTTCDGTAACRQDPHELHSQQHLARGVLLRTEATGTHGKGSRQQGLCVHCKSSVAIVDIRACRRLRS